MRLLESKLDKSLFLSLIKYCLNIKLKGNSYYENDSISLTHDDIFF